MANERAPGVSFICAVQTWRQLAAVAEPARGCGRILIIASAGVEPRRGRRNRHHPVGAVTVSSSSQTAKAPRRAPAVVTELTIGGTLAARLAVGAVTLVGARPDDPQRPCSRRPPL
jgi:hypothetical protein